MLVDGKHPGQEAFVLWGFEPETTKVRGSRQSLSFRGTVVRCIVSQCQYVCTNFSHRQLIALIPAVSVVSESLAMGTPLVFGCPKAGNHLTTVDIPHS